MNQQIEEPPDNNQKISIKEKTLLKEQKIGSFLDLKVLPYTLEIYSDLPSCYYLWEKFSPKKTLFETWEFRYAFYLGYKYKPYFLLAKKKRESVALLPLWFDKDRKIFTWFGSDWQEENHFWGKDIEAIKFLLKVAPTPLYLNAISQESISLLRNKFEFREDDPKYVLDLKDFKTHEDWLMTLKKNDRRDLRKDRNRILKQNPKIIFDNFSDLEVLIQLSKKRFEEKGEKPDWADKRRIETFKNVITLAGKTYQIRMIKIEIEEKPAGVDLIGLYKERYYAIKCGYNVRDFKGIGNFMNLIEVDDAISLDLKKIDFLQNNYHWKSRWFSPIPLFKYEKK